MNAQCPMTNVMTGQPRESGAQEKQRHGPVGRPRPANSATVSRHWPLAIGHSLVIGYWLLVIARQGGSIKIVNGRAAIPTHLLLDPRLWTLDLGLWTSPRRSRQRDHIHRDFQGVLATAEDHPAHRADIAIIAA